MSYEEYYNKNAEHILKNDRYIQNIIYQDDKDNYIIYQDDKDNYIMCQYLEYFKNYKNKDKTIT